MPLPKYLNQSAAADQPLPKYMSIKQFCAHTGLSRWVSTRICDRTAIAGSGEACRSAADLGPVRDFAGNTTNVRNHGRVCCFSLAKKKMAPE